MGTVIVHWGYSRRMEKAMETTTIHWGYIGKMENEMETGIPGSGRTAVGWYQDTEHF